MIPWRHGKSPCWGDSDAPQMPLLRVHGQERANPAAGGMGLRRSGCPCRQGMAEREEREMMAHRCRACGHKSRDVVREQGLYRMWVCLDAAACVTRMLGGK